VHDDAWSESRFDKFWLDPCAIYDSTSWMKKLVRYDIAVRDTDGTDVVCPCAFVLVCPDVVVRSCLFGLRNVRRHLRR
jgi:hypothetical protein